MPHHVYIPPSHAPLSPLETLRYLSQTLATLVALPLAAGAITGWAFVLLGA